MWRWTPALLLLLAPPVAAGVPAPAAKPAAAPVCSHPAKAKRPPCLKAKRNDASLYVPPPPRLFYDP